MLTLLLYRAAQRGIARQHASDELDLPTHAPMTSARKERGPLAILVWLAFAASMIALPQRLSGTLSAQTAGPADEHLLLAFRALPPHEKRERPLYELAQRITGFIDGRQFPPTAVITDKSVRYGVYSVRRVRVLKTSDSRQSPSGSRGRGVFVLAYNSLYKLCATGYRIRMATASAGSITYDDCEGGRSSSFPVATTRAFPIYELDTPGDNVFQELWKTHSTAASAPR